MRFEKEHIISEIIRTTQENGGIPLGKQKFASETGIKESDWCGIYWTKWSIALIETGYEPNKYNEAYDEKFIIKKLVDLIKEIKKFPTKAELRIKNHQDKTFPSHNTFQRLAKNTKRRKKFLNTVERIENYLVSEKYVCHCVKSWKTIVLKK